jgi:hypothetical protein
MFIQRSDAEQLKRSLASQPRWINPFQVIGLMSARYQ